jgi:hypothetical protein
MKAKILFLALFSLFLASCVTQRRCTAKFPVQSSRDSIYIEKLKEVPVYIKGDTVKIDVPINCPDQDIVLIENSKLKQDIKILNGKLVSNTIVKPDTVFVHTKETITKTKEVKVPEPVKFIPKIVKIFAWIGGIGILLFIIWLVLKYGKGFLGLLK